MCLDSFDRLNSCGLMNTGMQTGYFVFPGVVGVS